MAPDPHAALVQPATSGARVKYRLDDCDLTDFIKVAANFGSAQCAYVVTPNVDHLIRFHESADFRALYADAAYVLLDSRFVSYTLRLVRGLRLPVCTGSDLTARLFADVIRPDDRIVIVGASAEQVAQVRQRYGLRNLIHHNPPMGFIKDPAAVEACLQVVEAASPYRFCFLAVGSPQQEIVAQHLLRRGVARGLALCIGASIDFITGREKRAPSWVQKAGFEWAFRLSQNPRRLAKRYLVRGPRFFAYVRHADVELRHRDRAG